MRTLVMFVLLSMCAFAGDTELLKKQLDSIQNGEDAKKELFRHIGMIKQWATDGQSSKEARERINMCAVDMAKFWGEDSAEILKKRLNGMVSVLNGEVIWSGTPDKFRALKEELVVAKQTLIDGPKSVDASVEETPKSKYYTGDELLKRIAEMVEIEKTDLRGRVAAYEYQVENIYPYQWSFTGKLTAAFFSQYGYVDIRILVMEDNYQANVIYLLPTDKVNKDWKKGDTVTVTGYISNGKRPLGTYPCHRSIFDAKGKHIKNVTLTEISMPTIFAPEVLDIENQKVLLRLGWDAREFK